MAFMFNVNLSKLSIPQLWEYYMALMDKYVSLPVNNPQRKIIKMLANVAQDEFFSRIEKKVTVA